MSFLARYEQLSQYKVQAHFISLQGSHQARLKVWQEGVAWMEIVTTSWTSGFLPYPHQRKCSLKGCARSTITRSKYRLAMLYGTLVKGAHGVVHLKAGEWVDIHHDILCNWKSAQVTHCHIYQISASIVSTFQRSSRNCCTSLSFKYMYWCCKTTQVCMQAHNITDIEDDG